MRLIVAVLLFSPLVLAQNAGQRAAQMASQQSQQQIAIQQTQQASQQAIRTMQMQTDAALRANQAAAPPATVPRRQPGTPFRVTHAPAFSPRPGTFTGRAPAVTIRDASKGAVIYYTTDGSTPTEKSQLYTSPILLSSTTTLKAMAIAPSSAESPTARGTYVVK